MGKSPSPTVSFPPEATTEIPIRRVQRTWNSTLNHWAFTDAVAAEMHAAKPLKPRGVWVAWVAFWGAGEG